jgi:hypothetical protein
MGNRHVFDSDSAHTAIQYTGIQHNSSSAIHYRATTDSTVDSTIDSIWCIPVSELCCQAIASQSWLESNVELLGFHIWLYKFNKHRMLVLQHPAGVVCHEI